MRRKFIILCLLNEKKKIITAPGVQNHSDHYLEPLTVTAVNAEHSLSYQSNGVSEGQFNKLRQGKVSFQARLDLHQCSCAQAKKRINDFIETSKVRHHSCCLIIHGKGQGLVKGLTDSVLRGHEQVIAFHSTKPCHGGMGALYVLLSGA